MDLPFEGKISLTNLIEMGFKRHEVDMDLQIKEDISEDSGSLRARFFFPIIVKISLVKTLVMSRVIQLVKVVLVFS